MELTRYTINLIGRGMILLGVLIMLSSYFFKSEKHPGFQWNLKSMILRGPYIWENKDWYTGPGYRLQNIGFAVMMIGVVVTFGSVFG
ncbi:MAG: hypothetical protein K9N46_15625 [Candidatus Marinimicrobia bacterium]|nr:hypothetical protein [Candidatus Neomarinimicrobiota bacterium]MCF7830113.1 hypothetical protein [Candidatus Neomarinimicrobiota bacterium]MCF7882160.1 hypothetical protein [Candidatus Neomarinimicrobiota bacterium]